jgi:hypothetical protein
VNTFNSKSLNEWSISVADRYKKIGLELSVGVNDDEIIAVERELDFQFDEDFKALYKCFGGFRDNDWTPELVSLWTLQRVVEQASINFVPFADYSIGIFFYGFLRGQSGVFRTIGYSYMTPEKIADTFTEAVNMIETGQRLLC